MFKSKLEEYLKNATPAWAESINKEGYCAPIRVLPKESAPLSCQDCKKFNRGCDKPHQPNDYACADIYL